MKIKKTVFIKEFLEHPSKCISITRPRKFGKTLNLLLLKNYLNGKSAEIPGLERQEFPVIHIDFSHCQGKNYGQLYHSIWQCFRRAIKEHVHILEKQVLPFALDIPVQLPPPNETEVFSTPEWLLNALRRKHAKKVYVLLDDLTSLLNQAHHMGCFEKLAANFKLMLSGLCHHPGLKKLCCVGVMELKPGVLRESTKVFGLQEQDFSTCFGFTYDEIPDKELQEWYGGYRCGSTLLLQPFSVCEYYKHGVGVYWPNTCPLSLGHDLNTIIVHLLGLPTPFQPPTSDPNLIGKTPNDLLLLLYFSGYLTRVQGDEQLQVPNLEISNYLQKIFQDFFKPFSSLQSKLLLSVEETVDLQALEHCLREFLSAISYNNYNYPLYMFHVFTSLLHSPPKISISMEDIELRIDCKSTKRLVVLFFVKSQKALSKDKFMTSQLLKKKPAELKEYVIDYVSVGYHDQNLTLHLERVAPKVIEKPPAK